MFILFLIIYMFFGADLQDGRVNAFYSTPSIYTDAKHDLDESWPLKSDDYFPWAQCYKYICRLCIIPLEFLGNTIKLCIRYADRINAYWTGYFTSRPAIKGYVRLLSGYYLVLEETPLFFLDHQGFLMNECLNVKSHWPVHLFRQQDSWNFLEEEINLDLQLTL